MPVPGSNEDVDMAQATAVTVLTWAMSTITDKLVRRDAWEAVGRICKREADKLMVELKHEARLDWRKPPASRTPSGTFSAVAVTEALKPEGEEKP